MVWCRQTTSHYLSQCWPSSMSPYGAIRSQWDDYTHCSHGGWYHGQLDCLFLRLFGVTTKKTSKAHYVICIWSYMRRIHRSPVHSLTKPGVSNTESALVGTFSYMPFVDKPRSGRQAGWSHSGIVADGWAHIWHQDIGNPQDDINRLEKVWPECRFHRWSFLGFLGRWPK